MNITLSADTELIKKAREFARQNGTSLNQIIRDYLMQVTGTARPHSLAEEFKTLAKEKAGRTPKGFRFNREEANRRR